MNAQQFVFCRDDWSIEIVGTGKSRAVVKYPSGKIVYRCLKYNGFLFGKRNKHDKITDDHRLLEMIDGAGYPFVALSEETCAESLLRMYQTQLRRDTDQNYD